MMCNTNNVYRWIRCGENIHFLNTEYEDYSSTTWKVGFYFSTNDGNFIGPFDTISAATEAYEIHLHLSEAIIII